MQSQKFCGKLKLYLKHKDLVVYSTEFSYQYPLSKQFIIVKHD